MNGLKGCESIDRSTLAERLDISKSVLNNALPLMSEMGLVESNGYKRAHLALTEDGRCLLHFKRGNELNKIQKLGARVIERSPVLKVAHRLVRQDGGLNSVALGKEIGFLLGKNWTHPNTYRGVGRTCLDVLAGLELIHYKPLRRRGRDIGTRRLDIFTPTASATRMFFMISQFRFIPVLSMDKATQGLPSGSRNHYIMDFRNLVDLGLVEEDESGGFVLSKTGSRLLDSEDKTILGDVILEHPPAREIIRITLRDGPSFDILTLGAAIQDFNDADWKDTTKRSYGKKFLSWLKASNLITKGSLRGKYLFLPRVKERFETEQSPECDEVEEELEIDQPDGSFGVDHWLNESIVMLVANPDDESVIIAAKENFRKSITTLIDSLAKKGDMDSLHTAIDFIMEDWLEEMFPDTSQMDMKKVQKLARLVVEMRRKVDRANQYSNAGVAEPG